MAFPAKFVRLSPRRGRSNFARNYCYRGLGAGLFLICSPVAAQIEATLEPPQSLADAAVSEPDAAVLESIEAAARAWDVCLQALPRPVAFPVRVGFSMLPCEENKAVAARAKTNTTPARGLTYPAVLAAYVNGTELDETDPTIELNSALLPPAGCLGARWATELPTPGAIDGSQYSLFSAVQHELGHLIGLDVGYDVLERSEGSQPSVFLTRLYSNRDGAALTELTDDALRTAVSTPLNVAWSGKWTRRLASTRFSAGVPQLYLAPTAARTKPTPELLGDNARLLSRGRGNAPLDGKLLRLDNVCTERTDVGGQFVRLSEPSCGVEAAVTNLIRDGAALIIVEVDMSEHYDTPELNVDVPVVLVDSDNLALALETDLPDVWFRINSSRLRGADARGRAYVFTPEVYDPASSLVHLEPLSAVGMTPRFPTSNLPELGVGFDETCGVALSQLMDLGYAKPGCGDGIVDSDEACDQGPDNSDTLADSCRHSCDLPACGDAVTDAGEQCDDGVLNAQYSDACRPGCILPRCGDGVRDLADGEWCDDGSLNSDTEPNRCRQDCTLPRCGDGVPDTDEACDEGALNGEEPDRCRADCVAPRCGDGIIDPAHGETCDDGNVVADPWCDEMCQSGDPVSPDALLDAGQVTRESVAPDAGADAGTSETIAAFGDAGAVPAAALSPKVNCSCLVGRTRSLRRFDALVAGLALLLLACNRWVKRRYA